MSEIKRKKKSELKYKPSHDVNSDISEKKKEQKQSFNDYIKEIRIVPIKAIPFNDEAKFQKAKEMLREAKKVPELNEEAKFQIAKEMLKKEKIANFKSESKNKSTDKKRDSNIGGKNKPNTPTKSDAKIKPKTNLGIKKQDTSTPKEKTKPTRDKPKLKETRGNKIEITKENKLKEKVAEKKKEKSKEKTNISEIKKEKEAEIKKEKNTKENIKIKKEIKDKAKELEDFERKHGEIESLVGFCEKKIKEGTFDGGITREGYENRLKELLKEKEQIEKNIKDYNDKSSHSDTLNQEEQTKKTERVSLKEVSVTGQPINKEKLKSENLRLEEGKEKQETPEDLFFKEENKFQCRDVEFLKAKYEELGSISKVKTCFEGIGCENVPSIPTIDRIIRESFESGEKFNNWKENFSCLLVSKEKKEEIKKDVLKTDHDSISKISKDKGVSLALVSKIAKEVHGDNYEKEFPTNELSKEKREEVIKAVSKKDHSSIVKISKETGVSEPTVTRLAKEVHGDNYIKEFPNIEKLSKEKREEIIKAVSKKDHASLKQISREIRASYGTVARIAKEIQGDNYKKEFPTKELTKEKREEIIKAVSKKDHASLNEISKVTDVAPGTVGEIAKKVYGDDYRKKFPTGELSSEQRKEIIEAVSKKNHDSLSKISREKGVSQTAVIKIAKEAYKDDYEKEFPTKVLSEGRKEAVKKAISKKEHGNLTEIAKETGVSQGTVAEIAKEVYEDEYEKEFPISALSTEKREEVIESVSKNDHGPLTEISKETGVSRITIAEIAKEAHGDKYREEFPMDLPALKGVLTHQLINIETKECFNLKREKDSEVPEFRCEESIYEESKKHADGGFSNDTKYLQKILSRELSEELKISTNSLEIIDDVQFDYTNNLSEDNVLSKVEKYERQNVFLFIVGTNWNKIWKDRVKEFPVLKDVRYPDNVRVINPDLFADLIGFKGDLREKVKRIIHFNETGDIDALIRIKENNYTTMDEWLI